MVAFHHCSRPVDCALPSRGFVDARLGNESCRLSIEALTIPNAAAAMANLDTLAPSVKAITSVQCRGCGWSGEKLRLVEKAVQPDPSKPVGVRQAGFEPLRLFGWRRTVLQG